MLEEEKISIVAGVLREWAGDAPQVVAVLGSGWKNYAEQLIDLKNRIPLSAIPHWPIPKVTGHGGEILIGKHKASRENVAFVTGRVHAYEGYSPSELVRGLRGMIDWGVGNVLLLNAAGSLHEERGPGSLMVICDHINFSLPNPLAGGSFLDLVNLYDAEWRHKLLEQEPKLFEGVYAGSIGPSYETPAEVNMFKKLGADAVGMSTIPEAIACRALGARVLGISMLTNLAAGVSNSRPSHEEVLEVAEANAELAKVVLNSALCAANSCK